VDTTTPSGKKKIDTEIMSQATLIQNNELAASLLNVKKDRATTTGLRLTGNLLSSFRDAATTVVAEALIAVDSKACAAAEDAVICQCADADAVTSRSEEVSAAGDTENSEAKTEADTTGKTILTATSCKGRDVKRTKNIER
jgi:hypothetical protein